MVYQHIHARDAGESIEFLALDVLDIPPLQRFPLGERVKTLFNEEYLDVGSMRRIGIYWTTTELQPRFLISRGRPLLFLLLIGKDNIVSDIPCDPSNPPSFIGFAGGAEHLLHPIRDGCAGAEQVLPVNSHSDVRESMHPAIYAWLPLPAVSQREHCYPKESPWITATLLLWKWDSEQPFSTTPLLSRHGIL